nr:hypothetical protein EAVNVH72_00641 [Elizabethkingia anophelis]
MKKNYVDSIVRKQKNKYPFGYLFFQLLTNKNRMMINKYQILTVFFFFMESNK